MLVMVSTGSERWLSAVQCSRMIPRSGFDPDGRCSTTWTVARSVSPGRTGLSQRSSSTPGDPRLHAASARVCAKSRKVSAIVWKPLAMSPPNIDCFAASRSMWKGCGSNASAKSRIWLSVMLAPSVRNSRPTVKSSK